MNMEMVMIYAFVGLSVFSLGCVWRNIRLKEYRLVTMWALAFATMVAIVIDKVYGINYVLYPLTAWLSFRILLIFIDDEKKREQKRTQEEN